MIVKNIWHIKAYDNIEVSFLFRTLIPLLISVSLLPLINPHLHFIISGDFYRIFELQTKTTPMSLRALLNSLSHSRRGANVFIYFLWEKCDVIKSTERNEPQWTYQNELVSWDAFLYRPKQGALRKASEIECHVQRQIK